MIVQNEFTRGELAGRLKLLEEIIGDAQAIDQQRANELEREKKDDWLAKMKVKMRLDRAV